MPTNDTPQTDNSTTYEDFMMQGPDATVDLKVKDVVGTEGEKRSPTFAKPANVNTALKLQQFLEQTIG